jgi:PPOX class probable F420-dependent enzyme
MADPARECRRRPQPLGAGRARRRMNVARPPSDRPTDSGASLDGSLWEVVRGHSRGILATVAPTGHPHLTNMHYLAAPEARMISMTTTSDRVKGRNLLRDPRASLHVQGDDWFTFAVAEGTVTIAVAERVGDAAIDELHELITALRGPADRPAFDEEMLTDRRMVVRLAVHRLYGQIPRRATKES